MAGICLDSCGPHIIFFQLTISEKKYVNELCSKTTGQKWIKVNKKQEILENILSICYMFIEINT